jgi:hypothetical protein
LHEPNQHSNELARYLPSPDSLFERLLTRVGADQSFWTEVAPRIPQGADSYLLASNPRLLELQRAYATLHHPALSHSQWSRAFVEADVPLTGFRGDCAYVWQRRDLNLPVSLLLTAYYLIASGAGDLLYSLGEDDYFGVHTVLLGRSTLVSRDLLDSVSEISFLNRWTGILNRESSGILDIGSGYGRLAHRIAHCCPNMKSILCADAVPESTFLCEYYLDFRGICSRAQAIPLDAIENAVKEVRPEYAVSIHCLDECVVDAAEWWIKLIQRYSVRYLMIVLNSAAYNGDKILALRKSGGRTDFGKSIARAGYRLLSREPKYRDPAIQRFGVSPTDYVLFELV